MGRSHDDGIDEPRANQILSRGECLERLVLFEFRGDRVRHSDQLGANHFAGSQVSVMVLADVPSPMRPKRTLFMGRQCTGGVSSGEAKRRGIVGGAEK